jgi:hypothetical protein
MRCSDGEVDQVTYEGQPATHIRPGARKTPLCRHGGNLQVRKPSLESPTLVPRPRTHFEGWHLLEAAGLSKIAELARGDEEAEFAAQ